VSVMSVSCQTDLTWCSSNMPIARPSTTLSTKSLPAKFSSTASQTKVTPPAESGRPKATTAKQSQRRSSSVSIDYSNMCSMATSLACIRSGQALQSSPQSSSKSSSSQHSSSQSCSSSSSQRSKDKAKQPVKVQSGRPRKGEDDPIKSHNRYSPLDEMDIDITPPTSRPVSVSPRRGRRRSPVNPPS